MTDSGENKLEKKTYFDFCKPYGSSLSCKTGEEEKLCRQAETLRGSNDAMIVNDEVRKERC